MFTHTTLGTNDVARAKRFYDAALQPLGITCVREIPEKGWLVYASTTSPAKLLICTPRDGQPATFGNGSTLGLHAATPEQVDAFYAAGLANGGTDEGQPGPRDATGPGSRLAYVRDPDGNKLCAFFPQPQA